jgi:hypothetical protein
VKLHVGGVAPLLLPAGEKLRPVELSFAFHFFAAPSTIFEPPYMSFFKLHIFFPSSVAKSGVGNIFMALTRGFSGDLSARWSIGRSCATQGLRG